MKFLIFMRVIVILGLLILNLNYLVEQRQCNKNVEIMIPLKHFSNFWSTLEMSLINCGTSLALNWSENYVIMANKADQETTFSITDTKLSVLVVTLSR